MVRSEQEYIVNTPILVTRLYRSRRGVDRDHGLHAALSSVRAHVLPDDVGPADSPDCRQPARAHPAAPRRASTGGTWRRRPTGSNHIRYHRADSVLRLTTDASDDRGPRGDACSPRRHRHADAGPRRNRAWRGRRGRPPLPRGDRDVLARVGALPRHPVRVAGRGDPRRDHAEAQRLRRHGRDRGGHDDVDSRGGRTAAATGTTDTAGCATPISS